MAFAAAASVTLLHKLPRFDLWKFRAAPGIFDPSFSSESGRAYWGGIVSLALTIFIAGLAATCAFSAADCMSCCFRSRKQRPPDSTGSRIVHCLTSARLWYVLGCTLFVVAASLLVAVLTGVRSGITNTVAGVASFHSLLSAVNQTISRDLLPPVEDGLSTGNVMLAALEAENVDPSIVTLSLDVIDAVGLAQEQLQATLAALVGYMSGLDALLHKQWHVSRLTFSVESASTLVWEAGAGVVAGLTALLLVTLFGLRATSCAAKSFRWCLCLQLNVLLFTWIIAAALFSVALVGADVCIAPGTAILSVLNATGNGMEGSVFSPAYESAQYYTSPCGSVPPAGAYAELLRGQSAALAASAALDQLNATLTTNATAAVQAIAQPFIAQLGEDLLGAVGGVNSTLFEVDCWTVSGAYLNVVDPLCNVTASSIVQAWVLFMAAAVVLISVSCSATCLSCRHPGSDLTESSRPVQNVSAVFPGSDGASERLLPLAHSDENVLEDDDPRDGYLPKRLYVGGASTSLNAPYSGSW